MIPSLSKILVLAAILVGVWYAFKIIGRRNQAGPGGDLKRPRWRAPFSGFRKGPEHQGETIDLVRAKDGKTFVPADDDKT